VYEFDVKYKGVRDEQSVILMRVMLLHPYKAFRIEDELNMSTGAELRVRLKIGTIITCLSPFWRVDKCQPVSL